VQPDLFMQIIFNLIQNAAHACENKGTVQIELSNYDNKVQIKVTDNGPGVPPNLQSKIFDPTFSTKAVGEGTGLGLAFVKKTLAAWGGTIYYDSTYVQGAQFIIELPIAF
jgi:signal transduction histidine kinase